MIYEIDKYTDYLCDLGINPNQFYICWLLYTKDYKNIRKYIDKFGNFDTEDLKGLIDKGYVISSNPNALAFNTSSLFVGLDFAEKIIIEPEEAFDELLSVYPKYVMVNNVKYPSTGLSFSDEKGLRELYTKELKKNKFLHKSIIESVKKWGEDNSGYAPFKIDKFITSRFWKELKKAEENNVKPRYY